MPRFRSLLHLPGLALLGLAAAPAASQGQVVEVTPGFIRAPFVRIFRTPDGGAQIRAPFVDVHAPAAPQRGPWRRGRTAPDTAAVEPAQALELERERLVSTWQQLNRRLHSRPKGKLWAAHLALPQWVVTPPVDGVSPDVMGQLDDIRKRYDVTANRPEYQSIARLREFQATHQQLGAYYQMLENSLTELQSELPTPPGAYEPLDAFPTPPGAASFDSVSPYESEATIRSEPQFIQPSVGPELLPPSR